MTSLLQLPIFDYSFADCDKCELRSQRDRGHVCYSYRPEKFNGLMIVGEGPGQQEVAERRPFVGPSGKLLRSILESVGLSFDECYVSNATCCKPPPKEKALHDEFPNAIPSCLGRLESEIAAVRPKVIMAVGASAWVALSGYDVEKVKSVPFECGFCNPQRKVGPVLACAGSLPNPADGGRTSVPCGFVHHFKASDKEHVDPAELAALKLQGCPRCKAAFKRLRPKMIKCPECGGYKRRAETYMEFDWDYSMTDVAGAIFEPAAGAVRKEHELDGWYAEQGVSYIIPTFHPAHILRGQQFLAKGVQKHFAKAKRLLGGSRPIEVKHAVTTDPAVVREFCYRWQKQGRAAPNFTVDIETEAVGPGGEKRDARKVRAVTKINCIGIGTTTEALVVDTRGVDPTDPGDPLLEVLCDFLTDDQIPKTYHHGAGYDLLVIDRVWGISWDQQVGSYHDDTMFAHGNLYPDMAHKLGPVTFECVDARAWKPAREKNGVEQHESFEELALYNARDVVHTAHCREHFGVDRGKALPGGRMARAGLTDIYEIDSKIRKIAVGMTMHGVPVDLAVWKQVGATSQKHIEDANAAIKDGLRSAKYPDPDNFNPNSTPQLVGLLYGRDSFFKLPVIATSDAGTPSTDAPTLQSLLSIAKEEAACIVLQALLDLRKHAFVARNYVNSPDMQPWEDGRIHPIWKPWGTITGRFSSSPNFQNWPQWMRKMIVAPPGRIFVGADYDQLELRLTAWLTGDKMLIHKCLTADDKRKLEPEHDPHSFVANLAFPGRYVALQLKDPAHDPDPTKKCKCETCRRKALRDIIKRVIYGLNYGAEDATVLAAIYKGGYEGPPITIEMIAHVRRVVYKTFPDIPVWLADQVARANASGELRSPLYGRRRIFPLMEVPRNEIYNYPSQSGGADIVNERTVAVHEVLPSVDPSAFMIAQGHDALYFEVAEDRAEAVAKLLTETLTCVKTLNGVEMTFSAGAAVSKNWKEAA